jgi:hypothetical protein
MVEAGGMKPGKGGYTWIIQRTQNGLPREHDMGYLEHGLPTRHGLPRTWITQRTLPKETDMGLTITWFTQRSDYPGNSTFA